MKFFLKVCVILAFNLFSQFLCFAADPNNAGLHYEFRATSGSSTNGGCYDIVSNGGTDYTNQDAAQLSLTDIATGGIGSTALSSATGGFTSAMVDNCIQLTSGTNLVTGFYEITAFTDTNNVTIDRAADDGAAGVSAATGAVGGALDVFTDALLESLQAGNQVWVKNDGTMVIGTINLLADGNKASPIIVEGYNTSRGDNPTSSNRPTLNPGSSTFSFDDQWVIKNFIVTTSVASGLKCDISCNVVNVKVTNSSASAGREAIQFLNESTAFEVELISDSGNGITLVNQAQIVNSYVHDCGQTGIVLSSGNGNSAIGNIVDSNVTGISLSNNKDGHTVYGNTIYGNTTGISSGTSNSNIIVNNIIDGNTTGASWTTEQGTNYFDYNIWNNTTDVSNVTKGDNAVTSDPLLTDPNNATSTSRDFGLGSGSPAINAAANHDNTGSIGGLKHNIGVDQDDVAAAGGAASFTFVQ